LPTLSSEAAGTLVDLPVDGSGAVALIRAPRHIMSVLVGRAANPIAINVTVRSSNI
jgi:hypothetical protein